MTSHAPLFWVKQIHSALEELQEIPLWGHSPIFPLEACAQALGEALHLPDMRLSIENTQMRSGSEITAGLGSHLYPITLELTPLAEPFFWIMAQEDVKKLCSSALFAHPNGKGFTSSGFQEGFYRFLSLHAAEIIDRQEAFQDLSLKVAPSRALPKEEALCMDVAIHLPKQTVWGRVVCPSAFREAFKTHFSQMTPSLSASPLAKNIQVSLTAEAGYTRLSLSQFYTVKAGDFIMLDRCLYNPSSHKGTVILSLNGTPLLRARLKGDSLKIVDYAFYYEDIMNDRENMPEDDEPSDFSAELPEEENHLWTSSEEDSETSLEQHIAAQDIQLSLTVEVARLKIHLDKLLHLQPGNVLELPIRPEQGVDLSIGGKKMAKAELVKLGDILGVKILHVGD
jgi:flagellar motor switch protein FliN/FliY